MVGCIFIKITSNTAHLIRAESVFIRLVPTGACRPAQCMITYKIRVRDDVMPQISREIVQVRNLKEPGLIVKC